MVGFDIALNSETRRWSNSSSKDYLSYKNLGDWNVQHFYILKGYINEKLKQDKFNINNWNRSTEVNFKNFYLSLFIHLFMCLFHENDSLAQLVSRPTKLERKASESMSPRLPWARVVRCKLSGSNGNPLASTHITIGISVFTWASLTVSV